MKARKRPPLEAYAAGLVAIGVADHVACRSAAPTAALSSVPRRDRRVSRRGLSAWSIATRPSRDLGVPGPRS